MIHLISLQELGERRQEWIEDLAQRLGCAFPFSRPRREKPRLLLQMRREPSEPARKSQRPSCLSRDSRVFGSSIPVHCFAATASPFGDSSLQQWRRTAPRVRYIVDQ